MRPSILKLNHTCGLGILGLSLSIMLFPTENGYAATTEALACDVAHQVVKTLANSAKWEMCWEPRAGYGYRLSQVIYTPPNGIRRKILSSMNMAQLFVPYDDNGARYFDIGYGINLARLTAAECPSGTLLPSANPILCSVDRPAGYLFKNANTGDSAQSESFALFGYYGIGAYYYTFQYTFFDDGSIEPAVGASGSLQRFAGTLSTGSPIGSQIGVNHNHLVIWRMDFDLDGTNNDVVERINFAGAGTNQRNMVITPLTTETKETNNLTNGTFWRVRNVADNNLDGRNISYEIEPSVTDQLRAPETFTKNDFYVTQFKSNEELVDLGPWAQSGQSNLVGAINGETVTDPVLWYGVNFHHVPRGEDSVHMPAHWQGFRISPRDVTVPVDTRPINHAPLFTNNPGSQTTFVNTAVNFPILASDPDGDSLSYSATGLPPGLSINASTGVISGTTTAVSGSYNVTVTVRDGHPDGSANTQFAWTTEASPPPPSAINGTNGDDILDGTSGNDIINGFAGNDLLLPGGGVDTMNGGPGDDFYDVDDPNDRVVEALNEGFDFVHTIVSYQLPPNVEILEMDGTGNLSGTGNDTDNIMFGNPGNDTLTAGKGNDFMMGNAGNDTYVFNVGDGNDYINNIDNNPSSIDTVRFGAGIAETDILAFHWGPNLVLQIRNTNDQVTVDNYYGTDGDFKIDRVEFANGQSWNQTQIQTAVDNTN